MTAQETAKSLAPITVRVRRTTTLTLWSSADPRCRRSAGHRRDQCTGSAHDVDKTLTYTIMFYRAGLDRLSDYTCTHGSGSTGKGNK